MLERNREALRQMRILRTLEESRFGVAIEKLAEEHGVSTRTIRRDLEALEEIGAPIESVKRDGKSFRKMRRDPFRTFAEMGLSLSELSALYMGRVLLECLAASPFRQLQWERHGSPAPPREEACLLTAPSGEGRAPRLPGPSRIASLGPPSNR